MVRIPFTIRSLYRYGIVKSRMELPMCSCYPLLHHKIQTYVQLTVNRSFSDSSESSKGELIYTGPLKTKIKIIKVFTLCSSSSILPLQYQAITTYNLSKEPFLSFIIGLATILQIASPLFIHYVCSRYVIHIYHNPKNDTYTAMTYSLLALEKYITFTVDDVVVPDVEIFSTIVVKKKSLFFDPEHFTDLEHYKRLLKYDQPIDFSIDKSENKTEKQKTE